ncbi:MAG TPA: DUF6364 family protein [Planctomycetota bacterium]|nr:DUF6364 family protein [Planctomycetota bacterium]
MTKLTLSVDEEVVAQAKRLAKENGRSVSAMFTQIVRAMAGQKQRRRPIGPLTRKVSGIISLPKGKTFDDVLTDALMDKYGLK